jgi:hypothetical protein
MCKFVLKKRTDAAALGQIRDIFIDNISVKARGTSTITGHAGQPLENIRMSNVRLFMEAENARDKRATDAIRIENVKGLQLRDVSVEWNEKETEPSWQSALVLKNVRDFTVDTFSGKQGLRDKDVPGIVLEDCADGVVRNSSATEGTGTFIHIKGAATKDIALRYNRTGKAKKSVTFENDVVKKAVSADKS